MDRDRERNYVVQGFPDGEYIDHTGPGTCCAEYGIDISPMIGGGNDVNYTDYDMPNVNEYQNVLKKQGIGGPTINDITTGEGGKPYSSQLTSNDTYERFLDSLDPSKLVGDVLDPSKIIGTITDPSKLVGFTGEMYKMSVVPTMQLPDIIGKGAHAVGLGGVTDTIGHTITTLPIVGPVVQKGDDIRGKVVDVQNKLIDKTMIDPTKKVVEKGTKLVTGGITGIMDKLGDIWHGFVRWVIILAIICIVALVVWTIIKYRLIAPSTTVVVNSPRGGGRGVHTRTRGGHGPRTSRGHVKNVLHSLKSIYSHKNNKFL